MEVEEVSRMVKRSSSNSQYWLRYETYRVYCKPLSVCVTSAGYRPQDRSVEKEVRTWCAGT